MTRLPCTWRPARPLVWPSIRPSRMAARAAIASWVGSRRAVSAWLIGAPRPTSTSADPPGGCGPAWERPCTRPANRGLTQDVSSAHLVTGDAADCVGRPGPGANEKFLYDFID